MAMVLGVLADPDSGATGELRMRVDGVRRTAIGALATAASGVALAVAVACACAWLSPPPIAWRGLPAGPGAPEGAPQRLEGAGFGYRTVQTVGAAGHGQVAYHLELGWPLLAMSGDSATVGARMFAAAGPPPSPSAAPVGGPGQGVAPRHWGLTAIWDGLLVDAVAYATALAAAVCLLRRSRARILLLSAGAGIWLSLLIAWGCGALLLSSPIALFASEQEARAAGWPLPATDRVRPDCRFVAWAQAGWGASSLEYQYLAPDAGRQAGIPLLTRKSMKCGWPLRAIKTEDPPHPMDPARLHRILHGRVIWPGMIGNTLFYGTALLTFLGGPGWVRRAVRRRRGLCWRCGYNIKGLARCPECDAPRPSAR